MGNLISAAQAALDNFYVDQKTRIPTQAAWDILTQDQKIAEWNKEGSFKFALVEAKKKEEAFNIAVAAKFDAIETTYQNLRKDQGTRVNAAIDAGYDISKL